MTNKIEISRELAQKVDDLLYILTGHDSHPKMLRKYGEEFWIPIDQLRAELCTAIAAPAVERQEPVACSHEWTDDGEFTLICTKCGHEENHEHSEFESRIGGKLMGNRHGERLVRDSYGTYRDPKVRTLWMGWQARANLTSPSAPVAVVLPERQDVDDLWHSVMKDRAIGWNDCLDKIKEMNQ